MPKYLLAIICLVLLVGCNSTPPPFDRLTQRQIAGPGTFSSPRWSPDGRYLAFANRNDNLQVYDTISDKQSIVTQHVSYFFNWASMEQLAYLKLRLNGTGLTYPILHDLWVMDHDGNNDHGIIERLNDGKDFFWLQDGHSVVILLGEPTNDVRERDVYLLDRRTGSKELVVSRSELQVSHIINLTLSADEKQLLIYARQDDSTPHMLLIVYDLERRNIVQTIGLDTMFENMDLDQYHKAGFGDDMLNLVNVGDNQWVIGSFIAFKGTCYNYSIYFLNLADNTKNFCIPSKQGPIAGVAISPDLSRVAFINARGPGADFLFIADLPQEYRDRLAR